MNAENALDAQPSQEDEEALPFWMKALAVVIGIPLLNSIVPGSVVALLTLIGLPEPPQRGKAESQKLARPVQPKTWIDTEMEKLYADQRTYGQ